MRLPFVFALLLPCGHGIDSDFRSRATALGGEERETYSILAVGLWEYFDFGALRSPDVSKVALLHLEQQEHKKKRAPAAWPFALAEMMDSVQTPNALQNCSASIFSGLTFSPYLTTACVPMRHDSLVQ
jgi:hypothetical protein